MIRNRDIICLDWEVGYFPEGQAGPDRYVHASVPGAAQHDIAIADGYPDFRLDGNYRLFDWMEDVVFLYRTEFDIPGMAGDEELWFVSKGIDYRFGIYVNGVHVLSHEGMFSPVEIRLTPYLQKSNLIEVRVDRVPKRHAFPQDRTQASDVVKPAVGYGWDWHPRLVPSGIWDDTGLQIRKRSFIKDCHVEYKLDDTMSMADIRVKTDVEEASGCKVEWRLFDASGNMVADVEGPVGEDIAVALPNPKLWWTHDHGTPYLYRAETRLVGRSSEIVDTVESRIGFRRIRMVMNDGAWREPKEFPKSRSAAPAQIELNGRRIFAKGSNWVCPEIFPGELTEERYEELLHLVVAANMNILRCWGGGIVNKDAFFSLCDSLGILVWQEFPLACNCYPDDMKYLRILEQEAVSIIPRLREHPCLGIWCGGNELFNNWSGMTDQSLPLRLLDSLCYRLSPEIPFIFTSPLNGMAHGNYLFRWNGMEVFEWMNKSHCTAYCEFGVPGISPKEVLEKIIPEDCLFPPREGTAWEDHHAFKAWDGNPDTWLAEKTLEFYFRKAETLDELIENSSLMQGEGYKAIFEEARRKKPYCSMALNWCFDEPWPSAANNSVVAYPLIPKRAYYDVAAACRPLCASARFSKFQWAGEEIFSCDLWLLNDSFDSSGRYRISVYVCCGDGDMVHVLSWETPELQPNINIEGPTARISLPDWDTDRFNVIVSVDGHPEMDSTYTLAYRKADKVSLLPYRGMNITE